MHLKSIYVNRLIVQLGHCLQNSFEVPSKKGIHVLCLPVPFLPGFEKNQGE
jgi:hypothetical protein